MLFILAIMKSIVQNYHCLTPNVLSELMCILLPAYVVCGKVMLLIVSACLSVWVGGGGRRGGHRHVTTTHNHDTIGQYGDPSHLQEYGSIQTC